MQIVRSLAGYSFGRSDLVRRAMAKKKESVMAAERKNFVYGNEEDGVKGCVANGISEKVANKIFDDMTDFAKYAFNKSHAAAYAVVAYQTAWLKCYYPVEFMAALMTSVRGNAKKILSYSVTCKKLGIELERPDVNYGYAMFSADSGKIRFGMAAIKGIGDGVVERIVEEREHGGLYVSLEDFIKRLTSKEVNKNTIENLIKSGAFDGFEGTRKQKMFVYQQILDHIHKEKKESIEGQMSLFEMDDGEFSKEKRITFPDVGEFEKEELLYYEKLVLGIYLSGHPLMEYWDLLKTNCTRNSADFQAEALEGQPEENPDDQIVYYNVENGETVVIGGILTRKSVKMTTKNTQMAFLTIEDLYGSVDVTVFPRDYEKYKSVLTEERKLFIKGRVDINERRGAQLLCSAIIPFEDVPCELWLRFPDIASYEKGAEELEKNLRLFEGQDEVLVYAEEEKKIKHFSNRIRVDARKIVESGILDYLGKGSVIITEKSIEH